MSTLRAAAATTEIVADNTMIIGGSILATTCGGQEAPLRASALLIEGDEPVCIVSCDVLGLTKDLADEAARAISEACQIAFDNILITATHTHHAPTTLTIHGYQRNEEFCQRTVAAAVEAAREAKAKLAAAADKPNECEAELLYALGQEATVGQNSRWHMLDGQITWSGHEPTQAVRPSGPHDPDLPVVALRRPAKGSEGAPAAELLGALFCHGTHNTGARDTETTVRSPSFFGLAAQELEKQHNAPFLYVAGAFGSSHRPESVSGHEASIRVANAVNEALGRLEPALVGPISCLKRPFTCHYREFVDALAATDVRRWCERWFDEKTAAAYDRVFGEARQTIAEKAGQTFDTWLQVIRLGEVAIVGIPGEMFATLGLEIRRRSPFQHTIVVGLANDEIGYIPDREAYEHGGYQTWVGSHSQIAPGTGEEMVEAALAMLEESYRAGAPPPEPAIEPLAAHDAAALQRFYNELSPQARWYFRPHGWNATYEDCARICEEVAENKRLDIVLRAGDEILGWAFLSPLDTDEPGLGIAIADAWCAKGYGAQLMERLIGEAKSRGKQGIKLRHVKDNGAAGHLYRKCGFEVTGEHSGSDGDEYWEMKLSL